MNTHALTQPVVGTQFHNASEPALPDRSIGAILIEVGRLSLADAEKIMRYQRECNVRFGEAAIEIGLLKPASLTDILASAGGVAPDGGDMITLIRTRDGKTTKETIDLVDMVRSADLNRNLELTSNDVVFVERAPRFYIYGEVQRAGFFRLERQMTVLQALSAGGGLSPRGTERGIRIKRRDTEGKLEDIKAKMDDVLQVDDVVFVKESLF